MADVKAKKKLQEFVQKTNQKFSSDQIMGVYKNSEKYSFEKQSSILKQLFKPYTPDFDKYQSQFENDIKKSKKTSYDAFVSFLNNITLNNTKPQIPAKPSLSIEETVRAKNDFESPVLCSTRVEGSQKQQETVSLSEIKERLAQVTQQGSRQGQQSVRSSSTFLRQSFNSSSASMNSKKVIPTSPMSHSSIASWNFSFNDDPVLPVMRMPKPIIGLPSTAQERAVISELLSTLIGINGSLIVPKMKTTSIDIRDEFSTPNHLNDNRICVVEFELNEQIQESIRDMLGDILPLANFYFQIQNFIEMSRAPDSGQVLQALSEAMSKLITDYYGTIAQLEAMHIKEELNLHKLLFYLRPIIQTMETLTKVCHVLQVNNVRGGNVLTKLHDNIALYSGDKSSQEILIYLTQKASEPYMEILKLWIFKGVIQDPKMEFLIEDTEKDCQESEKNENYFDNFWDKRYMIRHEKIPRFLEKQANIILRTGKYLNVVRECGKRVVFTHSQTSLRFSHTDEQNYVNIINDAYTFASKALLELIMNDNDLMGHLLSVKRYFLLHQGDFVVQFMDACEGELLNNVDDVIPMRLENLLELTLRLSSAKHDKYQDDLLTMLLPFDICTQMSKIIKSDMGVDVDSEIDDTSTLKGIECFTFGYTVHWPLSIVLNHMTISKYQLIFRQLFYCKHVENYLCRVWIANTNAKKFDHSTSELYRTAFTLRQRMMNAIQNLEYYMMIEVIEPVWHIFMQQLAKAKNIDDVLIFHEDFLDHCLKNCMLTYPDLLKRIISVCNSCISFCQFIETSIDEGNIMTFSQKVAEYDETFTTNVVRLLDAVTEIAETDNSEKFFSLCNRINFNHYYTSHLNLRRK
ncbi:CLUMA_CG000769, isoform A [Clunio marinus]|uniref:Gamma-tubulin complex component n=1 Tax=Clunio marinus TaxID=568069 RepID=A0A1J1HG27_9DIPT|nr:CLUMA_CG000769, isoform A [Clunio marinus]